MQLKHEILPNGNLKISADAEDLAELRRWREDDDTEFASDRVLHDAFEHMICNSELDWVNPEQIGALTEAPILGIFGETKPARDCGPNCREVGGWPDENGVHTLWVEPVERAWAYLDYALRSPLEDIARYGYVVFVSGM